MISKPHGLPSLPLSQTETGALATAPLSTVINAATNELYQDFYNLVHSDITIVSVSGGGDAPVSSGAKSPSGKTEESPAPAAATAAAPATNEPHQISRKLRMSALSFAQRRHELSRRLLLHTKSISHAYALCASSLPNSHAALLRSRRGAFPRLGATVEASSDALSYVRGAWNAQDEVQDALYFHHDGLWRSRGHAHDVLGALCVLGGAGWDAAVDGRGNENGDGEKDGRAREGGYWPDFPTDVALAVDRYEISKEKGYGVKELRARLSSAVRRKLVLGEVGWFGSAAASASDFNAPLDGETCYFTRDTDGTPLPWRVTIEPGGGAIRLTYGMPRTVSTAEALRQQSMAHAQTHADTSDNAKEMSDHNQHNNLQQYPMEARLSVLSESPNAPWKLLSLRVQCSPKTGESDHQLRMNKKQMFDLHRIGERVMIVEEAICKKIAEKNQLSENDDEKVITSPNVVPRPLLRLFEVTHAFALSMQLEMLSSQAEALRRGAWGGFVGIPTGKAAASASKDSLGDGIAVSPAYFFDETQRHGKNSPLAVMAVHFWSCDDRYGSPKVGDLSVTSHDENDTERSKEKMETSSSASVSYSKINQRVDDNYLPESDRRGEKRLSLCIRAVPMVGLVVSLSGGSDVASSLIDAKSEQSNSVSQQNHHIKRNLDKLLSSIQDPFQLSMSDALLAATVLCAERRCRSVVDALNRQKAKKNPSWIHLEVECGSILVAARITYPTINNSDSQSSRPYVVLFRLACDSRTGRYIPVFPRPASLLRLLACNDPSASETQSLRSAVAASSLLARSGVSAMGKQVDGAAREATGRIVRDSFDALARSIDTLGRRCGVGGDWNDVDKQSASLREKSADQACRDVMLSLMTCSCMSVVFGVAAIALKVACGVDPAADMAGGPIRDESNRGIINVPPLSVMLRQRMIEKVVKEDDGEIKRVSQLEGELFAVTAKFNDESLDLVCFDVLTVLESASSVAKRLKLASVIPKDLPDSINFTSGPPSKKPRTTSQSSMNASYHHTLEEVKYATGWFDAALR
ncbi:hypothetical protein HJC23_009992 [Cyclotella cryptica]|uniref:Mediator of RNA polymerase II transcription subunit 17 n=1 Tax=Cyclotella cryptica TaxID=29204 RepID=A0ABD3Q8K8_9STRA|eukprot:CCRYP_007768-RA/>CCRYP_007768-RA protein AED:0.15 eAED:0.15 QI:279/1/1/1/1/1/3/476/1034